MSAEINEVQEPGRFLGPSGSHSVPLGRTPRARRSIDSSTVTSIVTGLPRVVLSGAVVYFTAWVAGSFLGMDGGARTGLAWIVVLLWLASGAVLLHPATQPAVARIIFRYRRPTRRESTRLDPAWNDVLQRAGIDPTTSKYSLWVQDSPELNASAAGGSIVSVTRQALHLYQGSELSAILAHELGHHLGGHSWSRLLLLWFSVPFSLLRKTVFGLLVLLTRINPFIGLLVLLVLLGGAIVSIWVAFFASPLIIIIVIIAMIIEPMMNRRAEYRCDNKAIDLGYGPQLVDVFEGWLAQGPDDHPPKSSGLALYRASHPAVGTRIARAERRIDRGAG